MVSFNDRRGAFVPALKHASVVMKEAAMKNSQWTTPTFVEHKMDAEIGSYQEDGAGSTPPLAERNPDAVRTSASSKSELRTERR